MCKTWEHPQDAGHLRWRSQSEGHSNKLVRSWKARYQEYARKVMTLRGARADADVEDDEAYWAAYREIVDDFRNMLYRAHPEVQEEYRYNELYAEVAALYEVRQHQPHAARTCPARTLPPAPCSLHTSH